MEAKSGAQINTKAFIQSVIILLVLMITAGVLTRVLPAGSYTRNEVDGRVVIVPDSYQVTDHPNYPVWRWFTAPVEVLGGSDALIIITIMVFILLVAGAFAVMEKSGILTAALARIVRAFGGRKYLLLVVITGFFMMMGAFFGLFEEVVPLVPLMIALAYFLGWDALVGLGMSILATNMGFSAALTNPFTIGVAQRLAGLPMFSGFLYRVPIFLTIFAVTAIFLVRYAKKIEKRPESSLVFGEDKVVRAKYSNLDLEKIAANSGGLKKASIWFVVFIFLVVATLFTSPFVPAISDYALPIVGILFFIGGLGAGLLTDQPKKTVWKALLDGVLGILPGLPLIMMAASIKFIITTGGVMDTILNTASLSLSHAAPTSAAFLIYGLALLMELFIGSAGAKAVLMMPILLPLADLVGVTRQVTVLAYCFGDGFSNMVYPTSPVLLISLGLAAVSFGKWLKFTWKIWAVVVPITLLFLWLAVAIGYGPF
ncbi:MAG TPA: hypothetical protein VN376_04935 [Longilinea sp.]|nr:hypothetical protein [Longilinea sp.]